MRVREVIQGAIDQVKKGWQKGGLYSKLDDTACLVGSLLMGAGVDLRFLSRYGDEDTYDNPNIYDAAVLVAEKITARESRYGGGDPVSALWEWNDDDLTTEDDVLEVLKEAYVDAPLDEEGGDDASS